MKVLLINGSPHPDGCTATALNEVAETLIIPENSEKNLIYSIRRYDASDGIMRRKQNLRRKYDRDRKQM